MLTKRVTKLMLLTALSLLAGACANQSSFDSAFESVGNAGAGSYTRSIFSTHNF